MAKESTINQMKSEKNEPEDADEKANPNEGLTITKIPPKILSRYLSGPKRSCHDLCKYGIPHAIEDKPWKSSHKRVTKKERKAKVPEENVTILAGTKKSGSTSKPSQTSKTEKANSQVDIKEVAYEKRVTSEKNSPPFEETDVSLECNNSDLKQAQSEPSSPVQECSKSQTKREKVKNKTPSGSSSRKETESRSNMQTRKSLTGGKEKPTPPSSPLSSKHNVKKPQSLSSKSTKNMTTESSLKPHENVEEVKPELASSENLTDKILHVTEPAAANSYEDPPIACDSTLSSPSPSSSGDKSLKHTNKKTGKSAVSASSKKGLRSVAGNKGKVNVLHRTCTASQTPSELSSVSSSNSSLGKQSNATSMSSRRGQDHQGENVKIGYKMSTKVGATNKVVVAARKLTFRRGKVIEIQPQSNSNVPRRLKFRPVRILGDDMQRDINGARKRTTEDNKVGGSGVLNAVNTKFQSVEGIRRRIIVKRVGGDMSKIEDSKSGSDEEVVLRHQDMEGKKENPRLYNNVIEETATMLTELRKSKVKALVGAFETVISLDSSREGAAAEVSTAC